MTPLGFLTPHPTLSEEVEEEIALQVQTFTLQSMVLTFALKIFDKLPLSQALIGGRVINLFTYPSLVITRAITRRVPHATLKKVVEYALKVFFAPFFVTAALNLLDIQASFFSVFVLTLIYPYSMGAIRRLR